MTSTSRCLLSSRLVFPDGYVRLRAPHSQTCLPCSFPRKTPEAAVCAQVPALPLPLPPQPAASVLTAIAAVFAFAAQFAQIWLLTAAPPSSLREMAAQRRRCAQHRAAVRKQNMRNSQRKPFEASLSAAASPGPSAPVRGCSKRPCRRTTPRSLRSYWCMRQRPSSDSPMPAPAA